MTEKQQNMVVAARLPVRCFVDCCSSQFLPTLPLLDGHPVGPGLSLVLKMDRRVIVVGVMVLDSADGFYLCYAFAVI